MESLNKRVETNQNILLITTNMNELEFLIKRLSDLIIFITVKVFFCLPKTYVQSRQNILMLKRQEKTKHTNASQNNKDSYVNSHIIHKQNFTVQW